MTKILSLFVAALCALSAMAQGSWRMHPTFDDGVTKVVDTPRFVYFTSQCQPYKPASEDNGILYQSLFRYDKDDDELVSLSTDNLLASNIIKAIEYSPDAGLLVVVHVNNDVDFLYDDGKAVNIPDYRLADVDKGKEVNSIFIDAANNRVYLCTGFGYVALNTKRNEVAESRNYGTAINAMGRVGDTLLLATPNSLLTAPVSAPRLNLNDYVKAGDFNEPVSMLALGRDITIMQTKGGAPHVLYEIAKENGNIAAREVLRLNALSLQQNKEGVLAVSPTQLIQFGKEGSQRSLNLGEGEKNKQAASETLDEVWFAHGRKGLWSCRAPKEDNGKWTVTRESFIPNAPAPWRAQNMVYTKDRGLLVANHGTDRIFLNGNDGGPLLVSAYKDGFWTPLSPVYTTGTEPLRNPNGLAVDPANPDYVYVGSVLSGLKRINLSDGSDVIHLSRAGDPARNLPGFHALVPDQSGSQSPNPDLGQSWVQSCPFSPPQFDYAGNLWTSYADYDGQVPVQLHFYCWTQEDRLASTPENVRPPKLVTVPGANLRNTEALLPLMKQGRRNMIVYSNRGYDPNIVVVDTKGTPIDNTDDAVRVITSFTDQDGNPVDVHSIYHFIEDPSTGNVWMGHANGVFYFDPAKALAGDTKVNRVKVSRNDGTNLADYLLDGVSVFRIAIDGDGRKWFGTDGGGIVVTSSDGRTIERTITSGNSPIPSDVVYGLGYIPETRSMMISTDNGMCEHFLAGNPSGTNNSKVRAYPNPVEPGYSGYVTIDGLSPNSLVKIVDAGGSLVKEIPCGTEREVKWDVTNTAFRRVGSGVYFILCSNVDEGMAEVNVGKILVVN